jgi:hypothetical protein
MMRVAAGGLVAVLVAVPLAILPSPVVAWLAASAFVLGIAGAVGCSVSLVTASAVLALIEYAVALVIRPAPVDVVTAIGFGAALFLLLEIVHFAGRARGAHVGREVLAAQMRSWVTIAAAGAIVATGLAAGGAALRIALPSAALPAVVIAGALGALVTGAGVILLVTERKPLTDDGGIAS